MVGHADAAVSRPVLPAQRVPGAIETGMRQCICNARLAAAMAPRGSPSPRGPSPVVVGDDGRQRAHTDPVAHEVNVLAQELLESATTGQRALLLPYMHTGSQQRVPGLTI